MQQMGHNICDPHKWALKKITNFSVKIEFTWFCGAWQENIVDL